MRKFVKFFYKREIKEEEEEGNLRYFLELAEKYDLPHLKKADCGEHGGHVEGEGGFGRSRETGEESEDEDCEHLHCLDIE